MKRSPACRRRSSGHCNPPACFSVQAAEEGFFKRRYATSCTRPETGDRHRRPARTAGDLSRWRLNKPRNRHSPGHTRQSHLAVAGIPLKAHGTAQAVFTSRDANALPGPLDQAIAKYRSAIKRALNEGRSTFILSSAHPARPTRSQPGPPAQLWTRLQSQC